MCQFVFSFAMLQISMKYQKQQDNIQVRRPHGDLQRHVRRDEPVLPARGHGEAQGRGQLRRGHRPQGGREGHQA